MLPHLSKERLREEDDRWSNQNIHNEVHNSHTESIQGLKDENHALQETCGLGVHLQEQAIQSSTDRLQNVETVEQDNRQDEERPETFRLAVRPALSKA